MPDINKIPNTRQRSLSFNYEIVKQGADSKRFEKNWKKLFDLEERSLELNKIREAYNAAIARHPSLVSIAHPSILGPSSPGISLWMPGIALLAAYLKKKKGLEGLFVSASQEALITKIKELIISEKNGRWAFVFSAWGDYPVHKNALLIEKKGSLVQIALLDSLTSSPSSPILESLTSICRSLGLTPKTFYSGVKREFTNYGCAIFAMQDCVSFLQDPKFFSKISPNFFSRTLSLGSSSAHVLKELPPEYMIGMQSSSRLADYIEKHKGKSFILPKRNKTLLEYQEKYELFTPFQIPQNHYITHKMFKYMWFCVNTLKELPSAKIKDLIHSTLLI